MPRETPSPIDLGQPPVEAPGLGWAGLAIGIATLLLLALNAVSLRDWVNDLAPSPAQARAATLAEGWVGVTEAAGIARSRDWLHARWKAIEAARFGDGAGADASQ